MPTFDCPFYNPKHGQSHNFWKAWRFIQPADFKPIVSADFSARVQINTQNSATLLYPLRYRQHCICDSCINCEN
jgi:hypothetical protein